MKKTLIVLTMVLLTAMLFVSCDNNAKEPETKTYTVTFSTGEGGSDIASQSIEDGKTAIKPADPTRTGYVFVRWSATENGTADFDFSTKIAKDTTIYAVWSKVYKVGDEGPAGGWIFYDCDADNTTDGGAGADGLTSAECGWRYLEAASADLAATLSWGPKDSSSYSTEIGIGKGKSNTDKLLAITEKEFPAAKACADYSEGGYDDWFLPSLDELGLMYTNLKLESKGGTWQSDELYWSSSEGNSGNAWSLYFFNKHEDSNLRSNSFYVRPIRAFK